MRRNAVPQGTGGESETTDFDRPGLKNGGPEFEPQRVTLISQMDVSACGMRADVRLSVTRCQRLAVRSWCGTPVPWPCGHHALGAHEAIREERGQGAQAICPQPHTLPSPQNAPRRPSPPFGTITIWRPPPLSRGWGGMREDPMAFPLQLHCN